MNIKLYGGPLGGNVIQVDNSSDLIHIHIIRDYDPTQTHKPCRHIRGVYKLSPDAPTGCAFIYHSADTLSGDQLAQHITKLENTI